MGLRDYGVIVLRVYGLKALHVLGHIWLWGYRYIEFSDFSQCFFRIGRNPDVLESNGLRIRFQREKIHGNIIVAFFAQKFFFCGSVLFIIIKWIKPMWLAIAIFTEKTIFSNQHKYFVGIYTTKFFCCANKTFLHINQILVT